MLPEASFCIYNNINSKFRYTQICFTWQLFLLMIVLCIIIHKPRLEFKLYCKSGLLHSSHWMSSYQSQNVETLNSQGVIFCNKSYRCSRYSGFLAAPAAPHILWKVMFFVFHWGKPFVNTDLINKYHSFSCEWGVGVIAVCCVFLPQGRERVQSLVCKDHLVILDWS